MKVSVTRATPEDAGLIAAMNKQLIEDERHENPMTVAELTERMRGWLESDYAAFLFKAELNTMGYALINTKEQPAYLRQFFIARDQRRQGLGTAAFRALCETFGESALDLDVLAWNQNAIAFWKSLGFAERSVRMRYRKT